jgi:hypothetical protein
LGYPIGVRQTGRLAGYRSRLTLPTGVATLNRSHPEEVRTIARPVSPASRAPIRRTLISAATLLFVVSAAAGCSTLLPKKLDVDGLETQLANQLSSKLDTTGVTVSCPDDIKAKTGDEFDCTATVPAAGTITVRVKQTDDDGHITYVLVGGATPTPSA